MGNFKPRQFKPHNLVTIGGRQKILLRDEIEILELLRDGYWVEQNILRPKAIWLKHHEEREQPNISWNTFDHLLSRKFVKEHGTLHPIARFTITKHGEMEYDRLTKPKEAPKPADPTPVPPDLAVSSKPSVLEQQLKTAISFTDANLLRLKDNKYALVVHFDDFVSLMKATHTLGIDLPKEKDSPKQKRNISYPNV